MSAPRPQVGEKLFRRAIRSRGVSFWTVAAIGLLAFAANAAASPLYRVYQLQFRFSATTLTLLFTVYVVVLLVTLVFLGSASDYLGRRPMMLAGLALGAVACGLFLLAHGIGLLFAGRALQGVAVGLISGTASAALLDLRPESGITPIVSSAAPTGGQALGAIVRQRVSPIRASADPPHLVAARGGVHHRHRRCAGNARTRNSAPRGSRARCARTSWCRTRPEERSLRRSPPWWQCGRSPGSISRWARH